MELRDYQVKAIEDCRAAYLRGFRSVLLVVPTGAGKTVIGSQVVAGAVARGRRVLWLAGRRELVDQAAARLPGHVGVIMAGRELDLEAPVQVASIDTLVGRELAPVDLVVYDEAHHAVAATSRRVLEAHPGAWVLGLTATPARGDGAALGDVFDALVLGPTVRQLQALGHLVPCEVIAPARTYRSLSEDPVRAWQRLAEGRPGFAFHATVDASRAFVEQLHAEGVTAAHVDSETPAAIRAAAVEAFRAREVECLSSVHVFTEGVDVPAASVCLLARGCGNAATYLQMVGRVLRPYPGKHTARIIDLRGMVHAHGLPDDDREWSLEGKQGQARATDRQPIRQCAECGYTWRAAGPGEACAHCGYREQVVEQGVEQRAMAQVTAVRREAPKYPNASEHHKRLSYQSLRELARQRGYKPGWVRYRMHALYGGEW
jgi:superfamily II DNA or RNA helicase